MTMTDETVTKTKKKAKKAEKRTERRFVPVSPYSPWIVRVLGGAAALTLGAGAYGFVYGAAEGHVFGEGVETALRQVPSYLVASGSVLMGLAIWFGTSSDAPVRVGAPGVALEKGELRRMAWWAIEKISWKADAQKLVVEGKDEIRRDWTFEIPLASHADAVAALVAEARRRVPKAVKLDKAALRVIGEAREHAGMKLELEPLQVVGRKCAATGRTISYEPDARVCPSCERVYFKRDVPKKCKCGTEIGHMRVGEFVEGDETEEDEESDEDQDVAAEREEEGDA